MLQSSRALAALAGRARCVPFARALTSAADGATSSDSGAADAVRLTCVAGWRMGTVDSAIVLDEQRACRSQSQVIFQGPGASILAGLRRRASPASESQPWRGFGPSALGKSGLGQPCRVCWQAPPRFRPARRAHGRSRGSSVSRRSKWAAGPNLGTVRVGACVLLASPQLDCVSY